MVEEAAPFIIVDDEDGVRPVRAGRYRIVDLIDEVFARPDVSVRMVIL